MSHKALHDFQKEIVLVDSEKRPGFMIVTLISQSNQLKVKSVNCIQNQKKNVCLFVCFKYVNDTLT